MPGQGIGPWAAAQGVRMSRDANRDTARSEERRLRHALDVAERASQALSGLLADLALIQSEEDALGKLLGRAQTALDAGMVIALEEIGTGLKIRAARPDIDAVPPAMLPLIEGLTGTPRDLSQSDDARLAALTTHPAFAGAASIVSAPLPMGGTRRGVLLALGSSPNAFDDSARSVLQQLAQMAFYRLDALSARGENRLMAEAVDRSASGVAIADVTLPDKPLTYVNRAFETMTGYAAQEVLGTNCRFLSAEPLDSPERKRLREVVAQNGSGRFILRNRRKNGEPFWNELTIYPIDGENGQARYLVATQTDVSQRIEAQRVNEKIQSRIDDALAHSRDGFLMLAPNGEVILANSTTLDLFPSPRLQWASGTGFAENWADYLAELTDAMRPEDAAFVTPDLEALCQAPEGTEVNLPDGRTVLVRAQYTTEGTIVLGATDVTPLKSVERMLRQRVAAIESAPDGIAVADQDNRILYANSSLARLLSVDSEMNLVGRRWDPYYKSAEARAALAHIKNAIASDEKIDVRLPFETRDGDARVHDVSVSRTSGVGVILVVRDITDQLAARKRRAELDEQLAIARRQQSIAELSAGLAHDFNNLLSAINGSAVLISTDEDVSASTRRFAERIVAAGTQAARLVNRLLDMGRTQDEESLFDLRAATKDGLSLAETNLSSSTKLTIHTGDDVLEVHGNPTEAGQIVINLVLNSHHALAGAAGRVDVTLEKFEGTTAENVVVGRIVPGVTYARLSVADTGSGIPPEIINKIFEPYFSTKGEKGTGIGLASITAIVRRVNGAIAVHSVLGEGTRFDIFWPTGPLGGDEDGDEDDPDHVDLSGRLIMVVDDELEVAEVLGSYLERMGAEVAVVDDPELAIEAVQDDPTAWTAIVSDYSMGKINGGDLVEQVRKLTLDLPIFILTALARTISDMRINDRTVQSVFAKPANFRQISEALASIPASRNWDE